MTTPPLPPACRCGSPLDSRGLCTHCDYRPALLGYRGAGALRVPVHECPTGCVACRTRDSQCAVCRTPCGSPMAAEYHAKRCRAVENARGHIA